ncbi:hypothetical protein ACTVPT_25960 [Serratia bockelmannii]|uniref:hypothetical protein n=1 Tax=Serratia bockelmannii TaxID=2703793 RepID=UPI003FA7A73F
MDDRLKCKNLMDKVIKGTINLQRKGITQEKLTFNREQRDFINSSMVEEVCEDVIRTLDFHNSCQQAGIDDGRRYWCFKLHGEIIGITGYHYRLWDHPDIVWAAWFVAAPDVPALTKLGMISNSMFTCLTHTHFREMYIEVLGNGNNSNVYNIYKKLGLEEIATFSDFFSQGKDMVVMRIDLHKLREFSRKEYDLNIIY